MLKVQRLIIVAMVVTLIVRLKWTMVIWLLMLEMLLIVAVA